MQRSAAPHNHRFCGTRQTVAVGEVVYIAAVECGGIAPHIGGVVLLHTVHIFDALVGS